MLTFCPLLQIEESLLKLIIRSLTLKEDQWIKKLKLKFKNLIKNFLIEMFSLLMIRKKSTILKLENNQCQKIKEFVLVQASLCRKKTE
jgi:hypothetical protein